MFEKVQSIRVSERVFDYAKQFLAPLLEDGVNLSGYLQTFTNGREQGYYLTVYNRDNYNKPDLLIWAYQNRSSDDIMVVEMTGFAVDGNFSEEAYNNKKQFKFKEEALAAEYIVERIKEYFEIT